MLQAGAWVLLLLAAILDRLLLATLSSAAAGVTVLQR